MDLMQPLLSTSKCLILKLTMQVDHNQNRITDNGYRHLPEELLFTSSSKFYESPRINEIQILCLYLQGKIVLHLHWLWSFYFPSNPQPRIGFSGIACNVIVFIFIDIFRHNEMSQTQIPYKAAWGNALSWFVGWRKLLVFNQKGVLNRLVGPAAHCCLNPCVQYNATVFDVLSIESVPRQRWTWKQNTWFCCGTIVQMYSWLFQSLHNSFVMWSFWWSCHKQEHSIPVLWFLWSPYPAKNHCSCHRIFLIEPRRL